MKSPFFSTSEARKQLSSLVNQVKYQNKEFAIGRHGSVDAMLVPVKGKDDILTAKVRHSLKVLAKEEKLSLIILFGSYAKGHVRATSDLDIAVYPENDLIPDEEQGLYEKFADLFDREDVDLVNLRSSHSFLLDYKIFADGDVLYQKSKEFYWNERMKAFFNYHDFQQYFDRVQDGILKRLDKITS